METQIPRSINDPFCSFHDPSKNDRLAIRKTSVNVSRYRDRDTYKTVYSIHCENEAPGLARGRLRVAAALACAVAVEAAEVVGYCLRSFVPQQSAFASKDFA